MSATAAAAAIAARVKAEEDRAASETVSEATYSRTEAAGVKIREAGPREAWAVGTPTRDGRFSVGYMSGFAAAQGKMAGFIPHRSDSDIRRGRNKIAATFLGDERIAHAEWLFFIDDDIGWHPNQVLRAIGHGVDIVCGLYPKKTAEPAQRGLVFRGQADEHPVIKDLVSVKGGGTGFMGIRRRVLETLAQTAPRLTTDRGFYFDFFRHGQDPDSGVYLTEDYGFCMLARQAGFEVWLDRMIRLTHDDGWRVWDCSDAIGEGPAQGVAP